MLSRVSRRLFELAASLGLAVVSVHATIFALRAVNALTGPFVPLPPWPDPYTGLLFGPGAEETHAMLDFTYTATVNSLGFRGEETGVNKSHGIRAIAIGDSFTYGWGVSMEDAWCKRLESTFRAQGLDIEILDLGKPGTGPEEYCRIAECAVPRLKPDIVIVGVTQTEDLLSINALDPIVFVKDAFPNLVMMYRCIQARRLPPYRAQRITAGDVRTGHAKTARTLVDQMDPEDRARFEQLAPDVREAYFAGTLNPWQVSVGVQDPGHWSDAIYPEHLPELIRGAADRFRRINNIAHAYGASVVVLCIPSGFNVNRESVANWQRMGFTMDPAMLQSELPDDAIAEVCKQAGIASFYSVTGEFRKRIDEKGLYFPLDQHMTPAGHALFTRLIAPMVVEDVRKAAAQASPSEK